MNSTSIEQSHRTFERWLAYLDRCTFEKGRLDEASYKALLRAGAIGVDPAAAIGEVTARIAAAGGLPRASKLRQQAQRAYAYSAANVLVPGEPISPPKPPVVFDPYKLERIARRLLQPLDWAQALSAISVLPPAEQSPANVLRALYRPGEGVLIFAGDPRSQGDYLFEVPASGEPLQEIPEQHVNHAAGSWFLCQPVDGKSHFNSRTGKQSRRSEESVISWRYLVLESDVAPWRQWLSLLVQLSGCPLAAIYTSGHRSIHALVVVGAASKAEWDSVVRGELMPLLVPLGADGQAMTAIRLTRLPNAYRGQRRQRLLYLNPHPSGEPLCQVLGWPHPFDCHD